MKKSHRDRFYDRMPEEKHKNVLRRNFFMNDNDFEEMVPCEFVEAILGGFIGYDEEGTLIEVGYGACEEE